MASPKSIKSASIVAPAAPEAVIEAITADPGEVSAAKSDALATASGSFGSIKLPAHPGEPPENAEAATELTWIEIELVGEDSKPIAGEPYRVITPEGTEASGTLDEKGFARIDYIQPGTCKVSFPKLDKDAWKKL
ncbi:MAG: hypothetical protein WC718_12470 [Phycisphaerales bacterium]